MSAQKRTADPDHIRSRTSLKLNFLNAASIDDRLNAGNFRYFARVMQQADLATWTSTISDDRICAEVPGCKSRHTCNDHRKAVQAAGYWTFDSGSGRHPTRYILSDELPKSVTAQFAEKRRLYDERKEAERPSRDVVRRPRKASSRGGKMPWNTVVPTPPVHLLSPYQQARRLQDETPGAHTREKLTCACGKPAVRMIRERPSTKTPNGTPWEFECWDCELSDRLPPIEFDFWEWRIIGEQPEPFETSEDAYRRASDGW